MAPATVTTAKDGMGAIISSMADPKKINNSKGTLSA